MGLEIYKNANDNILFTGGGNILKRPYDYSFCYMGMVNDTQYIKVALPDLEEMSATMFTFYNKSRDGVSAQGLNFKYANGWLHSGWHFGNNYDGGLNFSTTELSFGGNVVNQKGGLQIPDMIFISYDKNNNYQHSKGLNIASTAAPLVDRGVMEYLKLKVYNYGGREEFYYPFNQITIWDRVLSKDELRHLYNNKSLNEPLVNQGLVCYLKFDKRSEILDFSKNQDGSDMRVGVRDYSGNNYHGENMNLPAGTLQEQLDYAKENLFVIK